MLVAAGTDQAGGEMVELRFAKGRCRQMKKNLRDMRPVYVVGVATIDISASVKLPT